MKVLSFVFVSAICVVVFIMQVRAQGYQYAQTVPDVVASLDDAEDDAIAPALDPEAALLARKQGKQGKKGKKGKKGDEIGIDFASQPSCKSPNCIIKDPVLPDEICQNDCPLGSGSHCEGRHYKNPSINIAFCVSD